MRGIELLHPKMTEKAEQLTELCKAKGIPLLITETWRTLAEQDALYAQGRTKPGSIVTNCKGDSYQSPHQWGVAFDFCKNLKGQEYSDIPFFNEVGALAKSIGLFWGGDFKSFVDRPHLELPEFLPANSTATLKKQYGTPESFKATWSGAPPNAVAAASIPASLPQTIRKGSKGDAVKKLQEILGGLVVDGDFGSKTDAAVRTYQAKKGLAADGIVGPLTWKALLEI